MKIRSFGIKFLDGKSDKFAEFRSDAEDDARRLKVQNMGHNDGQNNLPPSHAAGLQASEQQILGDSQVRLTELNRYAGQLLLHLEQARERLCESFALNRFADLPNRARESMDQWKTKSRGPLIEAWLRSRESKRALSAFCSRNQIQTEAPVLLPDWLLILGITAAAISEGLINSSFYAESHPHGWLGAVQQAIFVAGVNVPIAYVTGLLGRNLLHVDWRRKVLGALAILAYAIFMYYYTPLVAHYRLALAQDYLQASELAVTYLMESGWRIYDFNSILLIIATAGFSAAAVWAGVEAKGHYPGHAAEAARYRVRREFWLKLRAAYLAGIEHMTEPVLAAIDAGLAEAQKARDAYRLNLLETRGFYEEYLQVANGLQINTVIVIRGYRKANQEVRDTPAPGYFSEDPVVFSANDLLPSLEPVLAQAQKIVDGFADRAAELDKAAGEARQAIRNLRSKARADAESFFAEIESAAAGPTIDPPAANGDHEVQPESSDEQAPHPDLKIIRKDNRKSS
ncbi:MAG: hypothetical protein ACRERU_11530 [Methylococcales bacterium]